MTYRSSSLTNDLYLNKLKVTYCTNSIENYIGAVATGVKIAINRYMLQVCYMCASVFVIVLSDYKRPTLCVA